MAPPTRLRPHLNDLLQKNHELEHVVADLRHQLTQSSAKWADERKTLAVGCDALMASFAKFRARLDIHSTDWGDSEGEVEQNLDTGRQSEDTGEVDNGTLETERDQGSSSTEDLHERCRILATELQVKEDELEDSRRKQEAAEEEMQRMQRLLDMQSEQLRTTLASTKADTSNKLSPERTPDDPSTQANPSKSEAENTREKLDAANLEINRLKHLLQEWKRYGSEWKRDGQQARARISELQRREDEFSTQAKAAEQGKALLDAEIQRLTTALADQTAAVEQHRTACQESVARVHDLEAMVALLRARLSPDQLASFDSEQNKTLDEAQDQVEDQPHNQPQEQPQNQPQEQPQNQSQGPLQNQSQEPPQNPAQDQPQNQVQNQVKPGLTVVTQSPTPQPDINTNKRTEMIMLKIPYRSLVRKPSTENNERRDEQQNVVSSQQTSASPSIRVSPGPPKGNHLPHFNPNDFEVCIHTCNPLPCRNDSRSFLWSRRQPSLPRHALSTKKHYHCAPGCPGYRLLNMPIADATKEPRRAKCRPPTEAEAALAAEEARKMSAIERKSERVTKAEGAVRSDGSGEEADEAERGSARESETHEGEEERSPRTGTLSPAKRLRSRTNDGEESQRARKLRSRISLVAKP